MRRPRHLRLLAAGVAGAVAAAVARVSMRLCRDGRLDPLQSADAILVFGAGVWPTGPSLSLRVRVAHAAELYAEGWASTILCSGGRSNGASEASVMRALLLERGIPASAVIPDDGGTSTRAAIRSARCFGAGRWRRIIAVSSPYHMHRIRCEAERQGLEVILSPAFRPGPRTLRLFAYDVRQHVRELVAVASYACSARLATAIERAWGRIIHAAVVHLIARTRSFAGGADAVADASDTLAELIKGGVAGFSDTGAVLTPAAVRLPWPVRGAVLSRFGLRHRRLHTGVDIRAGYGSPICAAAGGHVLFAGWLGPYGTVTVIDHGGGLATVYAHQAGLLVQEGAAVTSGQMIGFVGATGKSSGAHLHFEVRVHGTPVDPLVYLS